MAKVRDTRTLVLPIEQDEIYMTLLDVECLSMMMEIEIQMERKPGGVFRSECSTLEGNVLSLEPTERIKLSLMNRDMELQAPIELTIFLEEIDDGTRIFFHSEGLQSSHKEAWEEFLKSSFIEPLKVFFADED